MAVFRFPCVVLGAGQVVLLQHTRRWLVIMLHGMVRGRVGVIPGDKTGDCGDVVNLVGNVTRRSGDFQRS